jgi:hypothetical protein
MLGMFSQTTWFEDFSDRAMVFSRWTHDEVPSESYPVVIIYDPEAAARAHARKLADVAVITAEVAPKGIGADLMPDGALIMQLRAALDDILSDTFARARVKAGLLATQTGGGARHYFLLTDNVEGLQAAFSRIAPPADIALNVWERGDLPALIDWLQPTRLESWELRDDQVRRVFTEHGDDGIAPRDARFFFYGGDQSALTQAAVGLGFKIEKSDGPVIASKDMAITPDELNALNRVISEWVDAFGVDYDGWEAAMLVKN